MLAKRSNVRNFHFIYAGMNILFINVMEERHGSTYRARRLASLLMVKHKVCYLESNCNDKNGVFPSEIKNGNRVISIPQTGSLSGFIMASIKRSLLCLREDFDLVFLQKAWPLTLPCLIIAKLRGKRVIVDCDDLDSLWFKSSLRKRLTSLTEKLMPRWADLTTTHNQYLKRYIKDEGGTEAVIVPQGVDTELFDPVQFDPLQEKRSLNLEGKKVYAFLGSFTYGSARDLHTILNTMQQIIKRHSNAILLIIGGGGPLEKEYMDLISTLGISNHVIITGRVPHSQVPRYLAASDTGLIFMSDDLANETRVSLKLLEYLSMNLQVVGRLAGESRDTLGEYCFLCQPTTEAMADMVLDVSQKNLKKGSARRFIKEHYDWGVVGKSLEQAIKRIEN